MLELKLFGRFELRGPLGPLELSSAKLRALLAYLALLGPRGETREHLTSLLWGSHFEEQARQNFRQALTRLKKVIGSEALVVIDPLVSLSPGSITTDVCRFETLVRAGSESSLREAVSLADGEFLSGIDVRETPWEEWLSGERQRFAAMAADALVSLGEIEFEHGDMTAALGRGEAVIHRDFLREDAHRLVMRSLAKLGRRTEALRHFQAFSDRLKKELDAAPETATMQCWEALRRDTSPPGRPPVPQDVQPVPPTYPDKPSISVLPFANISGDPQQDRIRVDAPSSTEPGRAHARQSRPWLRPAVVGAILALAAGGFAFWKSFQEFSTPPIELASKARMELPLPDKPSIAVLPFANISSEAGQQHFADGMTDNLITDLSKISSLFVIARNSTFVYQGKPVKISQVAEELGVRYVLEGSVQRAGDRVRVNAQLVDALSGGHIWADRFDGNVSDIFAAQDAFVAKIVEALQVRLTAGEKQQMASGKTKNLSAKEAFDEGWSLYLKYSPDDIAAAITALKRATDLDPEYGRAYAALALVYIRIYDSYWFKEFGMDGHEVWLSVQKYVELAKRYPTSLSYVVAAYLDAGERRLEDARRNAGRAIALDPNDPEAHIGMAWILTCSGEPAEALNFVETAMRLNPNYPIHYVGTRGLTLFAAGDLKQSADVLEEGVRRNPNAAELFVPLSSVLAQLGRREEARQMLQRYRPGIDQRGLEKFADAAFLPFWDEQPRLRERFVDGLRVAALPLDTTVASLVVELEGSDIFRRMFAAKRLGWFGPAAAQAVPALIEALKNEYVRQEAVQSLGKIGPDAKAAISALMAMQDEDPIIGFYAKNALKEIKGN